MRGEQRLPSDRSLPVIGKRVEHAGSAIAAAGLVLGMLWVPLAGWVVAGIGVVVALVGRFVMKRE